MSAPETSTLAATLNAWLKGIEKASAVLASVVVFALMCVVVVDVAGRKAFNAPLQGAVEIAELALPAIVFLGIAYVQAERGHIKLELFSSRLSGRTLWVLELTGTALALLISVIATIEVGKFAWEAWASGDHTMGIVHIPIWPARVAVLFGFCLLCVRLGIQVVETILDRDHAKRKIATGV